MAIKGPDFIEKQEPLSAEEAAVAETVRIINKRQAKKALIQVTLCVALAIYAYMLWRNIPENIGIRLVARYWFSLVVLAAISFPNGYQPGSSLYVTSKSLEPLRQDALYHHFSNGMHWKSTGSPIVGLETLNTLTVIFVTIFTGYLTWQAFF